MENKVQSEAITFKGNGSDGLFIGSSLFKWLSFNRIIVNEFQVNFLMWTELTPNEIW